MSKLEILKELETMIAFQIVCLDEGNWNDFDKAEDRVKDLEINILETLERKE